MAASETFSSVLVLAALVCLLGKFTEATRDRLPIMTEAEYDRLMEILMLPLNERATTKSDDRLYRKAKKYQLLCLEVKDPYRGQVVKRLTRKGLIMLPPNEIENCILHFHKQFLGWGSEKIFHVIRNHYFGISKAAILKVLPRPDVHSKPTQSFKNRAPPQPLQVSRVMECHQVELVDLITLHQDHFIQERYVLAILDCFSRFLWLQAVSDNQAATVSEALDDIYLVWGPPSTCIIHCDQGSEFEAISELVQRFNIDRVERSRSSLSSTVRSMICGALREDVLANSTWQRALKLVARNYNVGYHSSIKMSPYECHFGVKSNFIAQHFAGGDLEEEEAEEEAEFDEETAILRDEAAIQNRQIEVQLKWNEAAANRLKRQLVKHNRSKKEEASSCGAGEAVGVEMVGEDRKVDRGGLSLNVPEMLEAVGLERAEHYITSDSNSKTVHTHVSQATSQTQEEEREMEEDSHVKSNHTGKGSKFTLEKLAIMVSQETFGMDTLLNNAAQQGLTLDRDNAGDGNCMFYALQQQLEKHGIRKTHRQIRQELVHFLAQHSTLGEGADAVYLPDFVSGFSSYLEYLEYLEQDGAWGDNLVLLAAANLYHISIWVVSNMPDSDPIVIESVSGMSQFDIHLGHISELHYVTLRPLFVLCEYCGCLTKEHNCSLVM